MQVLHLSHVAQVQHDALSFVEVDFVSLECDQLARRCYLIFIFLFLFYVVFFIILFIVLCKVQTGIHSIDLTENYVTKAIFCGFL